MTSALRAAVEEALRVALGQEARIVSTLPLSGGSINQTLQLRTTAGTFVLKSHAHAPHGFFAAEAAGLRAIQHSGTPLAVPWVVAVIERPDPLILLEFLEPGRRAVDFDEQLGVGLAALHRASAPSFGFDADNYCGLTPQRNPNTARWLDFFRNARLQPQVELAHAQGYLRIEHRRTFQRLLDGLDRWIIEPAEGPALIHGDLWSGNLHVTMAGRPALLDPAASYSHREAEFGMMRWFGGFSPAVYHSYAQAYAFEPGWEEREPLYRLYHVLNHVNLFGWGYLDEALAIVRRYA